MPRSEDYVSPYLRRPLRTLEQAQADSRCSCCLGNDRDAPCAYPSDGKPWTEAEDRILRVDEPQIGFFKTRLVRGGPWCGVQIFWQWPTDPHTGEQLDRSPTMIALVNGEPRELFDTWVVSAKHPISAAEYHELRAQAMNGLNVQQKLDLDQMKPIF